MIVESVAQAAIEAQWAEPFYTDELLTSPIATGESEDVHAFTVLARVMQDAEPKPEYWHFIYGRRGKPAVHAHASPGDVGTSGGQTHPSPSRDS